MPRDCASCEHPQVREINHRLREDRPLVDISRWLKEQGTPITRQAIARHKERHLPDVETSGPGRRPLSGDFLSKVVQATEMDLDDGLLKPKLRDGIAAQAELNRQRSRDMDKNLLDRISMAMAGVILHARVVSPEVEALEGEYRQLLSGD
jgi:hypothetical protein